MIIQVCDELVDAISFPETVESDQNFGSRMYARVETLSTAREPR